MRLIQASNYHSEYAGSFMPMLRAILRLGLERGHDAQAVFLEGPRERPWMKDLEADGIPYRFVPFDGFGDLLAEDTGPTVLHVHFSLLAKEAAKAARRHPNTALYWHVHTALSSGPYMWLRNAVSFGLLSRPVREILCVAPDLADDVRRRLAPRSKVVFMPNAIDLERFHEPSADARRAARERLDLPADAKVLLHMGRDWPLKGGDLYLAAAKRLADAGRSDVLAVTVGAGEEAAASAARLGLDRFRRLETTNRVEDLYAAADVFVSPSRAEGMPFSMVEALACGTPVAASDIPGQRYVGESLGACRLVAAGEQALADGIESLLARDPEQAEADRSQARAWLERNMDVRVWADRLMQRYEAAAP